MLAAAQALAANGVGQGDVVALVLKTSSELVVAILATQRLRAVPMVINPSLPEAAIARRVALVAATLVVTAERVAEILATQSIDALAAGPVSGDLAFLQLTSGTSGDSRAAAVSQRALSAYCESTMQQITLPSDAVLAAWVPLHHDFGLVRFVFFPIYFGLHAHLLPASITSLGPWLRALTATRAMLTGAPDFAYRLAARTVSPEGIDLSALRVASNGAEPVRASSIKAFEDRFGCPGIVRPGYGLAEATLTVAMVAPGEALRVDARGAVGNGRALPGLSLRITIDGVPQAADVVGEIEVSGPTLFEGYLDRTHATGFDRSSFTADGWLRTGDTGYLDVDGVVFVFGRTRAMVKQAGSLIAPREVEEVVDRIAGVALSAAIGLPNASTGAEELVVVAEVDTPDTPEATGLAEAIQSAVRTAVGVTPGRVMLVARHTIPLTANRKLRHAALREQLSTARLP